MKQWLGRAPAPEELIAREEDARRERSADVAVVIPTGRDTSLFEGHLKALASQSGADFDVIGIYSRDAEFVEPPASVSMLHVREMHAAGIAGAYYLGEKVAVREGYKKIILADSDCLPESAGVVAGLAGAASRADMSVPSIRYAPSSELMQGNIPHHYFCFNSRVFEMAGYTYLPFFIGGEEFDFRERTLNGGFSVAHADVRVSHPRLTPVQISPGRKTFQYHKGILEYRLLHRKHLAAWGFIATELALALALASLGLAGKARAVLLAVWHGTGMSLGCDRGLAFGGGLPEVTAPDDADEVVGPDSKKPLPDDFSGRASGGAGRAALVIAAVPRLPAFFGKMIIFEERNRASDIVLMMLSARSHIVFRGRCYEAVRRRGALGIAGSLLLVAAALPWALALSLPLWLRGTWNRMRCGIDTRGYGLAAAQSP